MTSYKPKESVTKSSRSTIGAKPKKWCGVPNDSVRSVARQDRRQEKESHDQECQRSQSNQCFNKPKEIATKSTQLQNQRCGITNDIVRSVAKQEQMQEKESYDQECQRSQLQQAQRNGTKSTQIQNQRYEIGTIVSGVSQEKIDIFRGIRSV
jgi:hypothetical protein